MGEGEVITIVPALTPEALRSRFKARCEQMKNLYQNWQIRVHRSLSWLTRAQSLSADQPEARLLLLWIALNSLYSRWNDERNAPDADSQARDEFLRRACRMDPDRVGQFAKDNRRLVRKLLENPFLSEVFWREPENPKANGWATQDANHLDHHLKDREYCMVLVQAVDRVFVLRGQIVHGASTGGSRLNRPALRQCLMFLEALVPVLLLVVIDRGCDDAWPALCYPPLIQNAGAAAPHAVTGH